MFSNTFRNNRYNYIGSFSLINECSFRLRSRLLTLRSAKADQGGSSLPQAPKRPDVKIEETILNNLFGVLNSIDNLKEPLRSEVSRNTRVPDPEKLLAYQRQIQKCNSLTSDLQRFLGVQWKVINSKRTDLLQMKPKRDVVDKDLLIQKLNERVTSLESLLRANPVEGPINPQSQSIETGEPEEE